MTIYNRLQYINDEGSQVWRNKRGEYHREDGPAVIWVDGTKFWFLNGRRHNENGPAIIWSDGEKDWYLNDKAYTEQQWKDELFKRCFKP